MEIDFKKEFITFDFDGILINNNNPLINSYDLYIQYKQKYIISTKKNYESYQKLLKEYKKLNELKYKKENNIIFYTFITSETLDDISSKIKNLIISQKNNLSNFLNYINHLNDNQSLYTSINNSDKGNNLLRRTKIFTRNIMDSTTKGKLRRKTPTT
jgi:hypothetical protein